MRKRSRKTDYIELSWLDGYSGETPAQLFRFRNHERIDKLAAVFEEALEQKADREGHGSLSDEERIVLVVVATHREVLSGGFDGLFRSSACRFVPTMVDALTRIGSEVLANTAQRAISVIGKAPVAEAQIREAVRHPNSERDHVLEECDEVYYGQPGPAKQLLEFLYRNRDRVSFSSGSSRSTTHRE